MIGGDDDNVPSARQLAAVLICGCAGTGSEAAAVTVKHDWAFAAICRGSPDIQEETIFCERGFVCAASARLHGGRSKLERVTDARPSFKRRGGFETVRAGDRTRVGNAPESHEAVALRAADLAVAGFNFDIWTAQGNRRAQRGSLAPGIADKVSAHECSRACGEKIAAGQHVCGLLCAFGHDFFSIFPSIL